MKIMVLLCIGLLFSGNAIAKTLFFDDFQLVGHDQSPDGEVFSGSSSVDMRHRLPQVSGLLDLIGGWLGGQPHVDRLKPIFQISHSCSQAGISSFERSKHFGMN